MLTKGSRPFARLTLSGNVAYADGVALTIPFDVQKLSDSFGRTNPVPGFVGDVFVCQYGIYKAQLQLEISTTPTQIRAGLSCQSGTGLDVSNILAYSPAQFLTTTLNADRINTELRFPGTPTAYPIIIYASMLITGGGAGTVLASKTSLLIEQLTTY